MQETSLLEIDSSVIGWLSSEEYPSLRYRVLTELLDYPESDRRVIEVKNHIADSPAVKAIMSKMEPDGYWLQLKPGTKEYYGDGVVYGSFATTHFCLSYLSELGMTKENLSVAKAADRYLNLQSDDGDWWSHLSCLYGYNVRTFLKLGYKGDSRLQKTIKLMLDTDRRDHGYLCDMHEKRSRRKKSCIRGAAKVLMAFSELPEYWDHPRCLSLVGYFMDREGIFTMKDRSRYVNKDILSNSFPVIWRTNLWEILYSLSKMGYGNDPHLDRAWALLHSMQDEKGRLKLDWTPSQAPWKVGKRGEYSRWLTFYALLAEKYRNVRQ